MCSSVCVFDFNVDFSCQCMVSWLLARLVGRSVSSFFSASPFYLFLLLFANQYFVCFFFFYFSQNVFIPLPPFECKQNANCNMERERAKEIERWNMRMRERERSSDGILRRNERESIDSFIWFRAQGSSSQSHIKLHLNNTFIVHGHVCVWVRKCSARCHWHGMIHFIQK